MNFILTPYAVASALGALLAGIAAAAAYSRRAMPGGKSLTALLVTAALWSLFTALEYAAVGVSAKVFWAKLEYLGVATTAVFFLLLALEYNGAPASLTPRNIALLFVVPALTLLLVFTNEWHSLVWTAYILTPGSSNLMEYEHGIWYWLGPVLYSWLMMLLGTVLLLRAAFGYRHIYRAQAIVLLTGALVPWVGASLYALDISLLPGYDPTSLLIVFSGVVFTWGMFRYQLLDLVPIAGETVLNNLGEGVLVLDAQNRIVEMNEPMRALLGYPPKTFIGHTTAALFGARADGLASLANPIDTAAPSHLALDTGDTRREFEVRVSPLTDSRGNLNGRVVLLHDITERTRVQAALTDSEQRFRLLAENAADMIWILDNETQTFKYVSPAVSRLFGYTEAEFVGKHVSETVTAASYEFIRTITPPRVAGTLNGSTDFYVDRVDMLHRDGHVVPTEITMRFVLNPLTGKVEGTGIARDITERERAQEALRQANRALEASQAQIVQEQRAVAMLEERQRLGRDLHDNLGQVLGFVNLQAMAIRKFLADGSYARADAALVRLGDVVQNAQTDMRAYIVELKSPARIERRFLPALMNILKQFENETTATLQLELAPEISARGFDAAVGAELLSILQEGLNNIVKHAHARNVHLTFAVYADTAEISLADDGRGFDTTQPVDERAHFGLNDMRERSAQIGASLQIETAPGMGTRLTLCVPMRSIETKATL